jgi:hypothetical protein
VVRHVDGSARNRLPNCTTLFDRRLPTPPFYCSAVSVRTLARPSPAPGNYWLGTASHTSQPPGLREATSTSTSTSTSTPRRTRSRHGSLLVTRQHEWTAAMAQGQPDSYALLEEHFNALPVRDLPRRSDDYRHFSAAAAPLVDDLLSTDDETESPLDPPTALSGMDSGLPPTPPDALVSKQSSFSTPINTRSPPTPDPSPPRSGPSLAAPARPKMPTYPSSMGESFTTAREEASSEPSRSRSVTPLDHRLSTVEEDRGLGLAFECDDSDTTPTDRLESMYSYVEHADTMAGADEDKEPPAEDVIPDREWNTDLMRNVTVRRKRTSSASPYKGQQSSRDVVRTASPSPSPRPRRTSGLRERVEASTNSPVTPSIENFAQSIGWPREDRIVSEAKARDEGSKRDSTSSMTSVVEARIFVTPPRRRQTLRHSGKNMAYREGSPTPDHAPRRPLNRQPSQPDEIPLHRLVHKKVGLADRSHRMSVGSDFFGTERSISTPLSFRSRIIDSSAATLAHQESLRMVLQPAADMLSRSSSVTRPYYAEQSYNKRIASAPEPVRKSALSSGPRDYSQLSPSTSPRRPTNVSFQTRPAEHSPLQSPIPSVASPRSLKRRQRSNVAEAKHASDFNGSLPDGPLGVERSESATQGVLTGAAAPEEELRAPSAMLTRVRQLLASRQSHNEVDTDEPVASPEQPSGESPSLENHTPVRRGSRSSRGKSWERMRTSPSHDRASTSPEVMIRPSLDRLSTEEMARRNHEWRTPSEEHGRVSFDRSTNRTEEHGAARHLFASTTPFSQLSDTPVEFSEATAVSIFPHNNHSLLVVQQGTRVSSMTPEPRQLIHQAFLSLNDNREARSTPTPPFVDAQGKSDEFSQQPTWTLEPSTPPMQIELPQHGGVDSPLKNPRAPPEPPKIMFIPPTPAEELERQLVPGPPTRSDSHPQRRLSLVQRARRYSDNLLPTLLSRATNNRGRYTSDSRRGSHRSPQVPTVNDEDGTLHPFWRPRGFWDDFDDSESESEDEGLHPGGDTSDVEPEPEAEPPKRSNTIGKRLTSGFRGSGGFLIGNSLGVERHGTNKRRHHVTLPPHFSRSPKTSTHNSPVVLIQPPTQPLGRHGGGGISKRDSRPSLHNWEPPRRRASWRQGKSLPGLKKYHVQYIGLSGVKERFKERSQEKRRDKIRQSIGTRYYVESTGPNST